MERGKAIQILKEELEKIPDLRRLPPNNEEFKLWLGRVSDVIDAALDSRDKTQFFTAVPIRIDWSWASGGKPAHDRAQYDEDLTKYGTALKAIIQRHEITGMDTIQSQLPEDTTELAILLFDKMQFHLKVVEASKSCFVSGNYREAILNAFIKLIDYVKEITGLDLDGDDLMNRVFSFNYDKERRRITKYPLIRINELKNISDRDEQQGFMFLCKGAVAGIRNPKAHTLIPQTNPLHTLEYLALASLLIRRVEESKVVKSQEGASS